MRKIVALTATVLMLGGSASGQQPELGMTPLPDTVLFYNRRST